MTAGEAPIRQFPSGDTKFRETKILRSCSKAKHLLPNKLDLNKGKCSVATEHKNNDVSSAH